MTRSNHSQTPGKAIVSRIVRREQQPRSFRRATLLGAMVAATALILTACVGQGSTAKTTVRSNDELPAKDVTTTLKLWNYAADPIPHWWPDSIAEFNKDYPNVKVETSQIVYAQMTAKLLGSGISKSIPDGVLYNPADSAKLFSAGIIQDMTSEWNSFPDRADFPQSVVLKSGSKVISVQGYLNTTAIWYNKTILDKVGIAAPPTTLEQFDQALSAVHSAGYGGFLLSAQPNGSGEFDFLPWLYAYGQNYGHWDRTKVQAVFDMFGKWIAAGYIPKDVTNNSEGDNGNVFANGNYAFAQNGNWNLMTARAAHYKFDWGVSDFPAGPAGAHGIGGGEGFSIGAGTKYPALVFKLFQTMLLTKDAQIAILKETGSLPVRADAAKDPAISSNPDLATYAKVVQELGARPNTPKISDYLNAMGKIWNSFVGGSTDSSEATDAIIKQLSTL